MYNHHTKINKTQAFKLFLNHDRFYMNPCKLVAFGPWHTECLVNPVDWIKDYCDLYHVDYEHLTVNNGLEVYKKAFDRMYNNWSFYNTSSEMGYYAHFYTE